MTVAVGHHPATMPSYNSVDLDEVHSLSRYCFLYSSSWEACVVFFLMLRANHVFSFQYILLQDTSRPGFISRIKGPLELQGLLNQYSTWTLSWISCPSRT